MRSGCITVFVVLLIIGLLGAYPEVGIIICVFIAVMAVPCLILDSKRKKAEEIMRQQEENEREEKEKRWEDQIKVGNLPVYASLQETNRNSYFIYFGVHKDHENGFADIVSTPFGNAQDALIMAHHIRKLFNASECKIRTDPKNQGYIVLAKNLYVPALAKYKSDDDYLEFENPVFGKQSSEKKFEFEKKYTSGADYEHYVAKRLKENGFLNVGVTKASGDFGADIIAEYDGKKICFQCKLYNSPVGISAVQEVIGAKKHYQCDLAAVVTNGTFTDAAKQLAYENDVQLLDNFT